MLSFRQNDDERLHRKSAKSLIQRIFIIQSLLEKQRNVIWKSNSDVIRSFATAVSLHDHYKVVAAVTFSHRWPANSAREGGGALGEDANIQIKLKNERHCFHLTWEEEQRAPEQHRGRDNHSESTSQASALCSTAARETRKGPLSFLPHKKGASFELNDWMNLGVECRANCWYANSTAACDTNRLHHLQPQRHYGFLFWLRFNQNSGWWWFSHY